MSGSRVLRRLIWTGVGIVAAFALIFATVWAVRVARQHAALRPILYNGYLVYYESDDSRAFELIKKSQFISPDLIFGVRGISCEGLYTRTTDADVEQFAKVPGVRGLNVAACRRVTDRSVDVILGMESLEYLQLGGSAISLAGIERLRPMKPGLRIYGAGRQN